MFHAAIQLVTTLGGHATRTAAAAAAAAIKDLRASAVAARQPGGMLLQLQASGMQRWAQLVDAILGQIDDATIQARQELSAALERI